MNLSWNCLTPSQRDALLALCEHGPLDLPRELGEQLSNLGLAEPLIRGGYCVSPLGMTVPLNCSLQGEDRQRPGGYLKVPRQMNMHGMSRKAPIRKLNSGDPP